MKPVFITMLQAYVDSVNALALAKQPSSAQRAKVRSLGQQVLHHAQRAGQRQGNGARAASAAAEQRRRNQPFSVTWRSTGAQQAIKGWDALSALTGLRVSSLRVMMSNGRGSFDRAMLSPTTGEPDVATISKL